MKKILTIAALAAGCQALHAGQPAAPAVTTVAAAAGKSATVVTGTGAAPANPFEPKAQSIFSGGKNDHNPFWPIGWVKMDDAAVDNAAPLVPHVEDFTVTSILLNEPPIAVINGKEMAEGEVGALPISSGEVTVQLMAVQDGRVILRWENQNLVIPLHRQEEISAADLSQQQPRVGLP
jgi:hypothetical protein